MCNVSVDCAYCSRSAAWTKLPVSAITLNVCKCRRSIILNLSVKMNVCFEYFVLFDISYSVILMERKQMIRVTTFGSLSMMIQRCGKALWFVGNSKSGGEKIWIYK